MGKGSPAQNKADPPTQRESETGRGSSIRERQAETASHEGREEGGEMGRRSDCVTEDGKRREPMVLGRVREEK